MEYTLVPSTLSCFMADTSAFTRTCALGLKRKWWKWHLSPVSSSASPPTLRNTTSLPGLRRLYLRTSSVIWPLTAEEDPCTISCTPSASAVLTLSDAPVGPPWLSYSTSCTGSPFQPPPALIWVITYRVAALNIRPVEACGPERVSTKPIFIGAACAPALTATREANTMLFALGTADIGSLRNPVNGWFQPT